MGHFETIWRIIGPAGAISIVGIGLRFVSFAEFRIARWLVWSGAVLFGLTGIAWQLLTPDPWWLRLISGAVETVVVFVLFPMLLEWMRQREAKSVKSSSEVAR
jgi:hypothetical protein